MPGISRIFRSVTSRFADALKNNDVEEMERLRTKKSDWLSMYVTRLSFDRISPEMADLFASKFTEENWEGWGMKKNSRDAILKVMMAEVMIAGREELFDTFYNAGLRFNEGKAADHMIHYVLYSGMADAKKAGFVSRLLDCGIDKVTGRDHFAWYAVEKNCPQSFDLLAAATKEDMHRDNESLLRHAAQHGHAEMCRHLVEKHGANIELAITTDRTLGHEKGWLFLEDLRKALRPNDAPPPTIESLSRRVEELEKTVRELTEAVKKPQSQVVVTAPTPAR